MSNSRSAPGFWFRPLIFVLLLSVVGCGPAAGPVEEQRQTNAPVQPDSQASPSQTDSTPEEPANEQADRLVEPDSDSPLHAKLAVIEKGGPVVHQSDIDTWTVLLDRLSAKWPDESREKVASLLITGHKLLRDRGSVLGVRQVARLIDESIPPEGSRLLTCTDLFTTTVFREATGQSPLKMDQAPY